MISGCTSAPRKLERMKSTSAFTAARLCCVPPWSTKRLPSFARLGMLARLHERGIRSEDVLENVLCVACRADAEDLERCPGRLDLRPQLVEDVDRVLDRIALRELVGLAEHVAVGREQNALGRRGPAVEADERLDRLAAPERRRGEFLGTVLTPERLEVFIRRAQTGAAGGRFLLEPAHVDVVFERGRAEISPHGRVLVLAELDRAERREVLRVLRRLDQGFR